MKQIFKINNNNKVQSTATATPLTGRQKHRFAKTTTATTGLACRALLVLALLMGWGGSAFGVTWNTNPDATAVDKGTFYLGNPTTGTVTFNVLNYVSLTDILSDVNAAAGTSYSQDDFWQHFYARWTILNSTGNMPSWNSGYDDGGANTWRSFGTTSNYWYTQDSYYWYTYYRRGYCGMEWPTSFNNGVFSISCKMTEGSDLTYLKGAQLILYISTTDIVGATPANDSWANNGQSFNTEGNLLLKYTFKVEDEPIVDNFINEAAIPCATTSGSTEIARTESNPQPIDFSGVKLSRVQYARIYLANASGSAVDPTGLLTVTYGGNTATAAGTDAKNGLYVYDGGNDLTLSNISVTLDAGAGNFMNYKIVCLLSSDMTTASITGGNLNQEPKWQEEYTYTFTYPVHEERFTLDESILTTSMVEIDNSGQYRDAILSYYGKTAAQIKDNWYGRWYCNWSNFR